MSGRNIFDQSQAVDTPIENDPAPTEVSQVATEREILEEEIHDLEVELVIKRRRLIELMRRGTTGQEG